MSGGERPIGTAKGKTFRYRGLVPTPSPPSPRKCFGQFSCCLRRPGLPQLQAPQYNRLPRQRCTDSHRDVSETRRQITVLGGNANTAAAKGDPPVVHMQHLDNVVMAHRCH